MPIKISALLLFIVTRICLIARELKKNSKCRLAVIILLIIKSTIKAIFTKYNQKYLKYLRSLSFLNTSNLCKLKAGAAVEKIYNSVFPLRYEN